MQSLMRFGALVFWIFMAALVAFISAAVIENTQCDSGSDANGKSKCKNLISHKIYSEQAIYKFLIYSFEQH